MDGLARTLTFVVCLVLVIPFFVIVSQYARFHDPKLFIGPAIVLVAIAVAALFRPKGFGLDAAGLHIFRPVRSLVFPLQDIRSVMPLTAKELGFGFRTFGSGGFLGYFGRFYYRAYGRVHVFATDRSKIILITLADDRKIIITPDDTQAFMAAFQDLMKKRK